MSKKDVYCVFERCERSADEDNAEGHIFIFDSEEIGRNLELNELWEWIKNNLEISYKNLKEKESKLYEFNLDDLIREFKKESEGFFYIFPFQYTSNLNYIFDNEEQAKQKKNYLNSKTYSNNKNRWYYTRYDLFCKDEEEEK